MSTNEDLPSGQNSMTGKPKEPCQHATPAQRAGCPLCNPNKTVPELNAAAAAELTG